MEQMTPEKISAIAGVILAILFEYVPGLHDWYNGLVNTKQRLVMLGALVLVVGGSFGLSCAGLLNTFTCTWTGAWDAILALIAAVVANQSTYVILPKRTE